MNKTWQKGSALLIVGVMVISTLVALISVPVVTADTAITASSGRFDVTYDSTIMFQELYYDVDPSDSSYYLLGEGDGIKDSVASANNLTVNLTVMNSWQLSNVWVNITGWTPANSLDFNDNDPAETGYPSNSGMQTVPFGAGPPPVPANGTYGLNFSWDFDVLQTSGLGENNAPKVDMRVYWMDGSTKVSAEFSVYIYLSSIFDNDTTEAHEMLPNMLDATGAPDDVRFEAGDSFEAATLNFNNYDGSAITDLRSNVTPPSPLTFANGIDYAIIPGGIPAGENVNANYRVNVPAGTTPDIYTGTAVVTYTRGDAGGLTITETGREIDFEVDFNFRDTDPVSPNTVDTDISIYQVTTIGVKIVEEAPANGTRLYENAAPPYTPPTIDQSTYSDEVIKVEITLENNGNHPLYNVEFQIDPTVGPWNYFRNPQFFWAENGLAYFDDLTLFVDFLDVGENVTFIVSLIVDNDIPIGEHRLPISYTGFWFNTGELDEPTGFDDTNGATDLFAVFSIFVVDDVIASHVETLINNANNKGDITANTITMNLFNDEGYDFIDVTVQADFTGTPWSNPLDGGVLVWSNEANPAMPQDAWAAAGSFAITFDVDTDPDDPPARYQFTINITAVIEETLKTVTATISAANGVVTDFVGYGAELLITGFTSEDIIPGEDFVVTFDITNVGDDTARDLFIFVPYDSTIEYPWNGTGGEALFKEQFDWSNVFSDWVETDNFDFPEEMFYTVESLDVDNIREIIEINLYMDGVYSNPGARIGIVHITDLAPDQTTNATFTMFADKDLVNGKPYVIAVTIQGIDSEGNTNVAVSGTQNVEIWSSLSGESYNPVELDWFDTGVKALALLLFLIIIFAILMMILSRFKGGDDDDYDDEDDDDFGFEEDEDEEEFAFEPKAEEEPEVPPPAAPEELVEP